jgi:hypothetical protein
MPADDRFISLYFAAPPKPASGAPCNGCGACCAALPCPLSRLLLGHRTGYCPALQWQAGESRYVCGLVILPSSHLHGLPLRADALFSRLARRWIAAGRGCDFSAEVIDADAD